MSQQHPPPDAESMLQALTAGAQDLPESRVLDRLVGSWRTRTEWEPVVGRGVRRIEGSAENRWIFGGRVVESCVFDAAGTEVAKVLYAFDPKIGDYTAYSVTMLSSFFVVERGHHDPVAGTLVLEAREPIGPGIPSVRFQRVIRFGDDGYTMAVAYPDVPLGTYGPMSTDYDRVG